MSKKITKKARTQAIGVSSRSGTPPPENRQFGKPGGNKRGSGFWKVEDTARFKLEQMIKLSESDLMEISENLEAPLFERRLAKSLLYEGEFKTTESMMNQVYGYPSQEVRQLDITPPLPLSPRKAKKCSQTRRPSKK